MSELNQYASYRPSGVEWIGDVPQDWDVLATARVTDLTTGDSDTQDAREDGKYPFFVRSQTVEAIDTYSFDGEAVLTSGDGAGVGKIFHHFVGKLEFHQRVYLFHNFRRVTGRYFFYFLREHLHRVVLAGNAKSTVDSLRRPMLRMFPLCLPTLAEQETIVEFLDYETAKIDALIAMQQQLIALLGEKRQAVISHAVTKGLNPDAPMRDSGIEWLGEVPEHWTVCRIKQIAKRETGHTPSKKVDAYWVDCEIPWVSLNDTGQLKHVDFISETAICINEKGMANSSAHLLPPGCVVFTRDASIGLAAITSREMAVSQHVIAWDCDPEIVNNEYLLLVFYAMEAELERFTFGATLKTIGMPDVNRLTGAFPPLQEQADTVKHVFSTKEKLSASIEKAEKLLDILEERRTALISAAVTGKIDVRGWKLPSSGAKQETETEVA